MPRQSLPFVLESFDLCALLFELLKLFAVAQTQFGKLRLLLLMSPLSLGQRPFSVTLPFACFVDLPEHVVLRRFQSLGGGTEFGLKGQVTLGKTSLKFGGLLLPGRSCCFLLTHGLRTQTGDFLLQRVDLAQRIVFGRTFSDQVLLQFI
ncbi:hypothetical protein RHOFW510R12_06795 [Rhodanobacter sp. FW510-R12]